MAAAFFCAGCVTSSDVTDTPIAEKLEFVEMRSAPGARQGEAALRFALLRDPLRQDRRLVVLTHDYHYCYPETGEIMKVFAGFESDFASIPRGVRGWINPFGKHAEAAVVHDWLYAVGEANKRKYSDDVFRVAMREQKVGKIKRNIMHRAVRRGGAASYGAPQEWRFRLLSDYSIDPNPPQNPGSAIVDKVENCELDFDDWLLLQEFSESDD